MAAGAKLQIGRSWGVLVVTGVLSAIAGVLALVWPDITLLALALITGINLLLVSALAVGQALGDGEAEDRTLRIVFGVLGIIAGLVVVRRPGETLLVIVLAVGIWLVISGIVQILGALFVPGGRVLRLVGGAIDAVLGVLVLALPELSLKTLAVLIGLAFILRGLLLVLGGWQLRRTDGAAGAGTSSPAPA